MNILFLTLVEFNSVQERGIYTDLLREFINNGHRVYAISPLEKRTKQKTFIIHEGAAVILRLEIGNTQKTSIIEKGINTLRIERTVINAIKKHFSTVKFDLVLYSTPPITLVGAIEYVKNKDKAKTYLMLKDIFPQNAVDIGILSTTGLRGLLFRYFRNKEKKLYSISNRIGCMSPANVDYILTHNPEIDADIVEVCPNSIEIIDKSVDDNTKMAIRNKYGIPADKKVFVYGGNLGKPQDIPFLIKCLRRCARIEDAFFLIVGDGTDFKMLKDYIDDEKPRTVKLMKRLPKEDYDTMVAACDYGLIFLDHRFSIPNYPSRLLAYMQAKLPVLAVTDTNTDIGKAIVDNSFGWWCESNNPGNFIKIIHTILEQTDYHDMQEREWTYLKNNYCVHDTYKTIVSSMG